MSGCVHPAEIGGFGRGRISQHAILYLGPSLSHAFERRNTSLPCTGSQIIRGMGGELIGLSCARLDKIKVPSIAWGGEPSVSNATRYVRRAHQIEPKSRNKSRSLPLKGSRGSLAPRVYDHTTTAMMIMSTPPPPLPAPRRGAGSPRPGYPLQAHPRRCRQLACTVSVPTVAALCILRRGRWRWAKTDGTRKKKKKMALL